LGQYTNDDATMSSISAANNVLSFKPKTDSYFFESLTCLAASSQGYNSLKFDLKGPNSGSVVIELQTQTDCSSSGAYKSTYFQVTGLNGNTKTVTVPLSSFAGANANAVVGFSLSGFSSTSYTWQLSKVELTCNGNSGASSAAPSSSAARSSSAVVVPSSSAARSSSAVPSSSAARSSSAVPSSSAAQSSSAARSSSAAQSSSVRSSSAAQSSSAAPSSSRVSSVSASRSTLVTAASATPSAGTCETLLIDDWISQSRLTFLNYNSFYKPTSDDGSCTSLTVLPNKANRMEIKPKDGCYFYSQVPCVNAKNKYSGISLRIKAPSGTTLSAEYQWSSNTQSCSVENPTTSSLTSAQLGWTFDGTEKLYLIPFSKYPTLNLEKITAILFSGFSGTVEFGPMAFYCGTSGEYIPPPVEGTGGSTATVPAPANPSATTLVVDRFASADSNAMGNWHGGDDGMTLRYNSGKLTITSTDPDYSFYTQVSGSCSDMTKYKGSYLHIEYSGSTKFTVALQQHNTGCNADIAPYPETWDSAEASRYAKNGHIWIPMSHFKIDFTRAIGFALKGFYTNEPVTLSLIEIAPSITTAGFTVPPKDETGDLVFACKRPNSFAFAIDDGVPELAQEVLKIIREENIKVTFFTVGAPLKDPSTNLTNVYKEMQAAGHQLAYHSQTHPKMEGLASYGQIDWEYNEDVQTMKDQFNGYTTTYFRPPFGTEGARMRSRLVKAVGEKATITNWSVDVEDWLWATTNTPEQQKVAFQRDVNKGGNLVVLHYLYPSTVSYLKEFIQIAKKTGKQLMRVDQCMMDPNAPPL